MVKRLNVGLRLREAHRIAGSGTPRSGASLSEIEHYLPAILEKCVGEYGSTVFLRSELKAYILGYCDPFQDVEVRGGDGVSTKEENRNVRRLLMLCDAVVNAWIEQCVLVEDPDESAEDDKAYRFSEMPEQL